jgi:pimeloyl-ACP methyl ester carboxylesterase
MRSLSRRSLLLGLVLLAGTVLPAGPAFGQGEKKKADSKDVSFKSFDGVTLKGTLYPNLGGKKDAVVILLHDFDGKKGGSSQKDNWPDLAASLQADGYVVLAFDFRGFGDSRNVSEKFWSYRHNLNFIARKGAKPPETIDQKDFRAGYYPYLVNDIAAAKAYLDRLNDQKACNTSSVVVIGAGQGATLGALWMAHECRRKKDKNSGPMALGARPELDEPESKDIACGVWLTISPKLEGRPVGPHLRRWLVDAGQAHKIPMGFALGKNDSTNDNLVSSLVKAIKGNGKTKVKVAVARIEGTNLTGSKLLEKALGTDKVIKKYLEGVMETRGNQEWREREVEKKAFYYVQGRQVLRINKRVGEEAPAVDLGLFLPAF